MFTFDASAELRESNYLRESSFVNLCDREVQKIRGALEVAREASPALPEALLQTQCGTLTMVGAPAARLIDYWRPLDVLGIVGRNQDGTGIGFSCFLPEPRRLPTPYVRCWTRLARHMAASLRLRRALLANAQPGGAAACGGDGEAVVDARTGAVVHAVGPAVPAEARAALRDAVRSIDRARGRLRRGEPFAAVDLWRGLVAGRWSVVERYESDGRRYYVAHKNVPQTPDPRALSPRERQVVDLAVQGHANKVIAHELRLGISAVANYLRSAQQKIGAKNRIELIRLARLLGAADLRAPGGER